MVTGLRRRWCSHYGMSRWWMTVCLAPNLSPNLGWKTKDKAGGQPRWMNMWMDESVCVCVDPHLVRCLALEAANIQWSDEGHVLEAVLHAHRFGPFVLKITPQFHHLSPPLYSPLFPRRLLLNWGGGEKRWLYFTAVSGQWKPGGLAARILV